MKNILSGLSLFFILTTSANATVVAYDFTASINDLYQVDPSNGFSHTPLTSSEGATTGKIISFGDKIVGRFTYDTSTALSYTWHTYDAPTEAANAYSYNDGPQNSFHYTLAPSGQTFTTLASEPTMIGVENHPFGYNVFSIGGACNGVTCSGFRFIDNTTTAFDNGQISGNLTLANFVSADLQSAWFRPSDHMQIGYKAQIESLTLVPEPHTYGMLLIGLGLCAVAVRRKQA